MGKNKIIKRISVLGLIAVMAFTGATLTGCSKKLQQAQENIDQSVTMVLNEDQSIQETYNEDFSNFTFLCADVEKGTQNEYTIDINGLATTVNDQQAYTTLNYLVDGKYFDEMDNSSHENIINTLATIVQNEKFQSVSINKINNVNALNDAVADTIETPLEGYHVNKNFLYGVGNLKFEDESNVVSFDTKEATKFSKTTTRTTYGYMGTDSKGNPKYGLITSTKTDYQTFFMGHTIYLQLTPEEYQAAKNNNSLIFDKFADMVKNKQTDKYVVQETNVQTDKEFSANMMDNVSLEK